MFTVQYGWTVSPLEFPKGGEVMSMEIVHEVHDIVRDFISESSVAITDEEIIQRRKNRSLALAALDAERAEHVKQIADLEHRIKEWEREYNKLQQRIAELEAQIPWDTVQDNKERP